MVEINEVPELNGNISASGTMIASLITQAGPKGKDGTGLTILGVYESLEALKKSHPTGNVGEAYMIDSNLYVWNALSNDWIDVGCIQGPQGPKGESGITPTIGENGNWYLGTVDTGMPSQGEQGPQGEKGESNIVEIVDNLESTSKDAVLSANQGRVLKEKQDNIENGIDNINLAIYKSDGINEDDANTTMKSLILTSVNTPVSGALYYIQTIVYGTKGTSNTRRSQVAIGYLTNDIYHRYYQDGNWSNWVPTVMDLVRSSYNIDNVKITTFFYTNDIERTPNGANGYLFTQRMHDDYVLQVFTAYDGIAKWIRAKKEGIWGEWKYMYQEPKRATIELQNSWVVHAAIQPQIYKDANRLYVAFIVKEGTGTLIATLPEGFRPMNAMFAPATNISSGKGTVVHISSSGAITCESSDVGGFLTVNATLLTQ